ncbi:uncharacterized protein LOC141628259 [Silene latifolia]|uniref:uncharacterized protein LOC141628259 n=1 Tax=Silene latifolia TaxID=37657 RepID=UPI003D779606
MSSNFARFTLMGNLLGARPTLKQITEFTDKYWGSIAKPTIQYFKKGWFSFRFENEKDMSNVLKRGPWKIGSHSLILKQWYPNFSTAMDRVSKIPIWVIFPDLDPYLWSSAVLSKMASKIGRHMFADMPTTCKQKLSFARIMVEADISGSLPDVISINTPYGPSDQRVDYEWLPYYCAECGKMGHQAKNCKQGKTKKNAPIPAPKKIYKPVTKASQCVTNPCLLGGTSVTMSVFFIPSKGSIHSMLSI